MTHHLTQKEVDFFQKFPHASTKDYWLYVEYRATKNIDPTNQLHNNLREQAEQANNRSTKATLETKK